MKREYLHSCCALVLLFGMVVATVAQTTTFTYQGRLTEGTVAATGTYDLRFRLLDADLNGTLVGGPLTNAAVAISNGLFAVNLDFGANVFSGADRWLEISVRSNGSGTFTTMSPRTPLAPTPYAIHAAGVSSTAITGTYGQPVSFTNSANSFSGGGAGLFGVNAATIGGLSSSDFWKLAGNTGTTPGTHFIGTTDNQPLEIKVNGQRAFRLEPASGGTPNVVGGSAFNGIAPGGSGVTIAGGHANFVSGRNATITGGATNSILGETPFELEGSTIGGGESQYIGSSSFATIGGGRNNRIWSYLSGGTISGGADNVIEQLATSASIAGGNGNHIGTSGQSSTVSGGTSNSVFAWTPYATVGGGRGNTIESYANAAVIGGGADNRISITALYATIAGGNLNLAAATNSAVGGGSGNSIDSAAEHGTIGGGSANGINIIRFGPFRYGNSPFATVSGGFNNQISGSNSVIGGGCANLVIGQSSVISGGQGNKIEAGLAPFLFAQGSTIGGGISNTIHGDNDDPVYCGTIAGGKNNFVTWLADFASIGGGQYNLIVAFAHGATIAGGEYNTVGHRGYDGAIAGGFGNKIDAFAFQCTIAGGLSNYIAIDSSYAAVGGGAMNTNAGLYATVPGGFQNQAGPFGFAAGRRAKANHPGAFVWADSTDADFASLATNQFNVRAAGGVRLETGGAGITLDGIQTRIHYGGTGTFGEANGFDFNTNPVSGAAGLVIEQGTGEGAGIYMDGDYISMWSAGDNNRLLRLYDEDGMVEKFYIDGAGNAVANGIVLTSARRFKENIAPLHGALDLVSRLQGVTFDWNKDRGGKPGIGFIAEDVAEILPDLVVWEDGPEGKAAVGVQYANITAVNVEAIKELRQVIDLKMKAKDAELQALKDTVAELKAVVADLQKKNTHE